MATVYWFTPPTRTEHRGTDRLFGRVPIAQGVAIVKQDDIYTQVEIPAADDFADFQAIYLGGHVYLVDETIAAELTDAGYGSFLTEADAYGAGAYGSGDFG